MTKNVKEKEFQTKNLFKQYLNEYFNELNTAKNSNQRIAFVSSMAPVEILRAFDFKLYFPENHSAIIGSKRLESNYIPRALNEMGYNINCCSYMLADIGSNLLENSPLNNYHLPPRPDLIVYNTNQCTEIKHWLMFYAKKYNVPIFGINTPHLLDNTDNQTLIYVEKQLEQLILDIETHFKIKFDKDKFQSVIKTSSECSQLWKKVVDFGKIKPSAITFFDCCVFMAMIVLLRGDVRANKFYQQLLIELHSRTEQSISAVETEQFRLIWCGLPIWGNLKYLSNLFYDLNTSIVNSIYASSWVFNLDYQDPIRSLAKNYTELFINLTDQSKLTYLINLINDWSAQGVIFHHSLSCKRNSDNLYGLSKLLKQHYNIPSITFEADHMDLKSFDKKCFTVLLEALLEQIKKQ